MRLHSATLARFLSRWPLKRYWDPLFDNNFDEDERLPRLITITFIEKDAKRSEGKKFVLQKCNDIIIGDRLTDNCL